MPEKAWKYAERMVAKFWGSQRNIGSGSLGRSDRTSSDSTHESVFIEVKYRRRHAIWTLYDSVRGLASKEGKIPLLALREHGRKETLYLVAEKDLPALVEIIKQRK